MQRILMIDDDTELCQLMSEFLAQEGFAISSAVTGPEGVEAARLTDFGLIILDVMLPGLNGFDVLRQIRKFSRTPIIMLTAKGEDVDRIVGLELGADDYLAKPFNPRELVARIRAIMRRTSHHDDVPIRKIKSGDVEVDPATRTVWRNGEALEFTSAEFDILVLLIESAGLIVSRETLAEKVLAREFNPLDRSIDMHVSNIRKKLGHTVLIDGQPIERIKAVRGSGYLYAGVSQ